MSEMSVLDVLQSAREVLQDPEHWTQGAAAVDAVGAPVPTSDPKARAFCAIGALLHVCPATSVVRDARDALAACVPIGGRNLAVFNDSASHMSVLRIYDCAIAKCKAAV